MVRSSVLINSDAFSCVLHLFDSLPAAIRSQVSMTPDGWLLAKSTQPRRFPWQRFQDLLCLEACRVCPCRLRTQQRCCRLRSFLSKAQVRMQGMRRQHVPVPSMKDLMPSSDA